MSCVGGPSAKQRAAAGPAVVGSTCHPRTAAASAPARRCRPRPAGAGPAAGAGACAAAPRHRGAAH